jgi:hypothetical protein
MYHLFGSRGFIRRKYIRRRYFCAPLLRGVASDFVANGDCGVDADLAGFDRGGSHFSAGRATLECEAGGSHWARKSDGCLVGFDGVAEANAEGAGDGFGFGLGFLRRLGDGVVALGAIVF